VRAFARRTEASRHLGVGSLALLEMSVTWTVPTGASAITALGHAPVSQATREAIAGRSTRMRMPTGTAALSRASPRMRQLGGSGVIYSGIRVKLRFTYLLTCIIRNNIYILWKSDVNRLNLVPFFIAYSYTSTCLHL
jgi:hypothetical protein